MKLRLPQFDTARVLVAGDLMLDRYWHGDTSRISPEAPVPVVRVGGLEERPGGAGNVALNIAHLGAHVRLLAVAGTDEAGATLARGLDAAGVECHLLQAAGLATITKLRVLSRHQQLIRLDFEDGFPGLDPDPLTERFRLLVGDADLVVLSDYAKGTLRRIEPLIEAARAAGKPVLVDPKGSDFARYRGATLITPNLAELEAVVGRCADEAEIVARGEALIERLALDALLVTRGEHGMILLQRGLDALRLPTQAREVFDVTGAGDTVISVLAAALAAGLELPAATALANLGAGIVVGKLGTAAVSVAELRRAAYHLDERGRGVVDEEELSALVADARAHGERIVMTNGCFDLLHAGHVGYLAEAAALGDRLIVAVNDDASVRALKGDGRPLNGLMQRMAVLAGLRAVDWVVPFAESTPERLICRLRPDLLVKGGDYRPDAVAGGRCVVESGGEVRILDYRDGCSTTALIERIQSDREVTR